MNHNLFLLPFYDDKIPLSLLSFLPFLSEPRRKSISDFRFSIDRKLSLYAELFARMELSKQLHLLPQDLSFQSLPLQKPILSTEPSLSFNLSHTRSCVLLGISKNAPIGVDLEAITKPPLEVMPTVFHPQEIAFVEHAPSGETAHRFFEIWTKKEAFTKCSGMGLSSSPNQINVLNPSLSPHFFSWTFQSSYLCSAFSFQPFSSDYKQYSEKDLLLFYQSFGSKTL